MPPPSAANPHPLSTGIALAASFVRFTRAASKVGGPRSTQEWWGGLPTTLALVVRGGWV